MASRPTGVGDSNQPRKHRILLLQNSSLMESYGGIEYYLDDLATQLVKIYGSANVEAMIPRRTEAWSETEKPYRYVAVPYALRGIFGKLENRFPVNYFRRALETIRQFRPTLIICGHVALCPLAYVLKRFTRVPYVTIAYGIECWGNLWLQDEWTLRRSRGIISISHWTKKILADRGYAEHAIEVVHPQLPSCYEKLPPPRRPRPEGGPFTFLTVSRLDAKERYKGHDDVLSALKRIVDAPQSPQNEIRYIIHGDGTDRERLESVVKELGLDSMVEFRAGTLNRSQFDGSYRQADVYIMPSQFGHEGRRWYGEGFGIVYLEAAAFGVPSIAYRCGGVTDIVSHDVDGILVEPGNIDELANAMVALVKNRERVFELGKAAHHAIMTRFTSENTRQELIAALNRW